MNSQPVRSIIFRKPFTMVKYVTLAASQASSVNGNNFYALKKRSLPSGRITYFHGTVWGVELGIGEKMVELIGGLSKGGVM
jgi:hypothetical protein